VFGHEGNLVHKRKHIIDEDDDNEPQLVHVTSVSSERQVKVPKLLQSAQLAHTHSPLPATQTPTIAALPIESLQTHGSTQLSRSEWARTMCAAALQLQDATKTPVMQSTQSENDDRKERRTDEQELAKVNKDFAEGRSLQKKANTADISNAPSFAEIQVSAHQNIAPDVGAVQKEVVSNSTVPSPYMLGYREVNKSTDFPYGFAKDGTSFEDISGTTHPRQPSSVMGPEYQASVTPLFDLPNLNSTLNPLFDD
jgi:hypothetical protein